MSKNRIEDYQVLNYSFGRGVGGLLIALPIQPFKLKAECFEIRLIIIEFYFLCEYLCVRDILLL